MTKKKPVKINGRVVKNQFELKAYQHLLEVLPKTMKVVYEEEDIPYTIQSVYRPDFRISFKKGDGTVCYLETKGNGRAFDGNVRRKMLSVKEQHPDKKFYIVFYSDGKIGPKRKDGSFLRQSDWARKNGFSFCIGINNIPTEWFE